MTATLPTAEPMVLPVGYGQPSGRTLSWTDVSNRLADAPRYWLATVRPDGRPHVVPTDGLWVDGALWFGGGDTVHLRNLARNAAAAVHLEDGKRAVIVEGRAAVAVPTEMQAQGLSELSRSKYGFAAPAGAYAAGVWRLDPIRALAWDDFPRDATRFRFRTARVGGPA
jgi:nitroimidazol reductase NimA-like FMN-containing flavoprotein (pyridoxamine 5'-phosphate oxidase superfamily)